MEDYSKLLPYIDSDLDDFKVFISYLNKEIDLSTASFNLYHSKITSWEEVGNVSKIGGDLNLSYTRLTSLGNLESVGGLLSLYNTPITSLGDLQSVGGFLYLNKTPNLKDLGKLKEVKGNIFYDKGTKVEELLKERGLV